MREFFAEIALFSRSDCELSVNKEEKRKNVPCLSQSGGRQGAREKNFKKRGEKMRKEENKPEAPERKITMGSLFDGIGGFPPGGSSQWH